MKLYRYEHVETTAGVRIAKISYDIVRETKHFYVSKHGKKIRKNAKNPYAHMDSDTALKAYITRTKNRVKILENELAKAKRGLVLAEAQKGE